MKKIMIIVAIIASAMSYAVTTSAQTNTLPASTNSVSWTAYMKALQSDTMPIKDTVNNITVDSAGVREGLTFATGGAYNTVADLPDSSVVTTIWTVTSVKSRSGKVEDQWLVVYTITPETVVHYALTTKGGLKLVTLNGKTKAKANRGDKKGGKYF